jgi:SNF family Na+-dependent transporter
VTGSAGGDAFLLWFVFSLLMGVMSILIDSKDDDDG